MHGHAPMQNRDGLAVSVTATAADGAAERAAAIGMIEDLPRSGPITLAADMVDFVNDMRERGVTPQLPNSVAARR